MIPNLEGTMLVKLVIAMGCDTGQSIHEFLKQNNITLNVYEGYYQLEFPTTKHEQLFKLQYSHILY
jgi:hypothetical protein